MAMKSEGMKNENMSAALKERRKESNIEEKSRNNKMKTGSSINNRNVGYRSWRKAEISIVMKKTEEMMKIGESSKKAKQYSENWLIISKNENQRKPARSEI
jgi:hypothetical protein